MFCTSCGTKLIEGAAFCQNCGHKVIADSGLNHAKDNKKPQGNDQVSEVRAAPLVKENSHKKTNEQFSKVIGVITTLVTIAFGRYVGIYIIIPLIGGFAAYWLFNRMLSKEKEMLVLGAAVQSGHLLWMIVGAFYLGAEGLSAVGLDALILLAGIIWLVAKPTKAPVIFLIIYQVLSMVINVVTISSLSPTEESFKALIVHIILRGFALVAMFLGMKEIRKPRLV